MILGSMVFAMTPVPAQLPAAQDGGKARLAAPVGGVASWLSEDDYPLEAILRNEEGTVAFELSVNPEGTITACKVISSASVALDQAICALSLKRGRFMPALDTAGKPIPATYKSRIRWSLPAADRVPASNWHSLAIVKLDAHNVPISCVQEKFGSARDRPGGQCDAYVEGRAETFLARLAGAPTKPVTLVVESAVAFEGDPGPLPQFRYAQAGHHVLDLSKTRFEVTETGEIENCSRIPTAVDALPQLSTPCRTFVDTFLPVLVEGKPSRAVGIFWTALSVLSE